VEEIRAVALTKYLRSLTMQFQVQRLCSVELDEKNVNSDKHFTHCKTGNEEKLRKP
jgi:hypothetical protein